MRQRVYLYEPTKPRRKRRRLGRYSRFTALSSLDGRTREAALMRRVREDLIKHVGGNPTFPQRLLIERAVILSLRLAQIDAKILAGESLTTHDSNFALAWNNAMRRVVVALGVEPAAVKPPTLAEYWANKSSGEATA